MTRRGFSLLEVMVALGIVALLVAILLPRHRELRNKADAGELGIVAEPPTVEDMEEAAEEAAEEHDIYDRVVALTENTGQLAVTVRIPKQGAWPEVMLRSADDPERATVHIDGKLVYKQVDGEIRTYLGMGEWEHLLGDVERKVAADREEMFRTAREKRFGPLPGWGDEG